MAAFLQVPFNVPATSENTICSLSNYVQHLHRFGNFFGWFEKFQKFLKSCILMKVEPKVFVFRCVNSQKKTALDLAATRGFIDCARWLWLNQWSAAAPQKIVKISPHSFPDGPQNTSFSQPTPSKPLKDCSSLFTKPDKPSFPLENAMKTETRTTRSLLREGKYLKTRPESNPISWKIKKEINKISFRSGRNTGGESTRPDYDRPIVAIEKPVRSTTTRPSTAAPRLLPQLTASLSRERSIPSVRESRHQPPTLAHLKIDVKVPASMMRPLGAKSRPERKCARVLFYFLLYIFLSYVFTSLLRRRRPQGTHF